ncbi:MAG: DUF3365 domain-containing protein [Planctomycetes bacterium]|nr:DUF3365 domain-containing protein [Planctomycetota bacterium]
MRQDGIPAFALAAAVSLSWAAAVGSGCGRPPGGAKPAAEEEEAVAAMQVAAATSRAEKAASRLAAELVSELMRALAAGDPAAAVDVCASLAQSISARVAEEEGVGLRRTALRLRNPSNAPDDFERAVLERWLESGVLPGQEAVVVAAPGGRRELRYMKPIVLMAPCTACHGPAEEIDPDVMATIRKHYPADRAVDFRPGDLRGAITARVPLDD